MYRIPVEMNMKFTKPIVRVDEREHQDVSTRTKFTRFIFFLDGAYHWVQPDPRTTS